jgi:diacylglycerol kinase (ATP)
MEYRKALDLIFTQQPAAVDGFNINGRFACMLCGLGFDAKVAHDFAQQPGRGLSAYIRQVVKNFFSARTYRFELATGDRKLQVDAYFLSIANSNQYGNNFKIAPQASLSDGLLDIVIVTRQNKLSFILKTLQQIRGKNKLMTGLEGKEKKAVLYFQTDCLSIMNPAQAPLHIDGDPAETVTELNIEVKKKCFRLFQPNT